MCGCCCELRGPTDRHPRLLVLDAEYARPCMEVVVTMVCMAFWRKGGAWMAAGSTCNGAWLQGVRAMVHTDKRRKTAFRCTDQSLYLLWRACAVRQCHYLSQMGMRSCEKGMCVVERQGSILEKSYAAFFGRVQVHPLSCMHAHTHPNLHARLCIRATSPIMCMHVYAQSRHNNSCLYRYPSLHYLIAPYRNSKSA